MSKFTNILKDHGLISDDESAPAPHPVAGQQVASSTGQPVHQPYGAVPVPQIPVPPTPFPLSAGVGSSLPDKDMVAALNVAISKNRNTAYDTFRVIFETMNGIADIQRYPMAVNATTASSHVTPDQILSSLDEKLTLLGNESKNFQSAWDAEMENTVNSKGKQSEQITATIEAKKAEIAKLEEQQTALIQSATEAHGKLLAEHAAFDASFQVVKASLDAERSHIAPLLSGATTTNG